MRRLLTYSVTIFFFLSAGVFSFAQDTRFDKMLERYELLCMQCLELRLRTALGENVSRDEAESLVNTFLALNKGLKSQEAEMSAAQRRRFSSISRWFTTGTINRLQELNEIPRLAGFPMPPVTTMYATREHLDLEVRHTDPAYSGDVFLLASVSAASDFSYGLMAGYKYGISGIYMSFRSDYSGVKTSYFCTSDGKIPDYGAFWASGEVLRTNLSATLGPMCSLGDMLTLYAGLGYGYSKVAWEDVDGNWARVSDLSFFEISVESGILCSLGDMAFTLGVQTVAFRTAAVTCGIGLKL